MTTTQAHWKAYNLAKKWLGKDTMPKNEFHRGYVAALTQVILDGYEPIEDRRS